MAGGSASISKFIGSDTFELQAVPITAKIFSTRGAIDADKAVHIARVFGIDGSVSEIVNGWYASSEGRHIWIHRGGRIKFFVPSKVFDSNYRQDAFPADEEAARIASSFLEKLRKNGLQQMPSCSVQPDRVSFDKRTYFYPNGTTTSFVKNMHVSFSLYQDETELVGPGAKLRVYIDPEGEVIGFIGGIWELESTREIKLKSPEQALKDWDELIHSRRPSLSVTIESMDLVYWIGSTEELISVIPCYRLRGYDENGKDVSFYLKAF